MRSRSRLASVFLDHGGVGEAKAHGGGSSSSIAWTTLLISQLIARVAFALATRRKSGGCRYEMSALGAVIAAMPMLMEDLEQVDGQRLVHIVGLDPGRRYEVTDPAANPPNYWPR
jgi:hypothetical protein